MLVISMFLKFLSLIIIVEYVISIIRNFERRLSISSELYLILISNFIRICNKYIMQEFYHKEFSNTFQITFKVRNFFLKRTYYKNF